MLWAVGSGKPDLTSPRTQRQLGSTGCRRSWRMHGWTHLQQHGDSLHHSAGFHLRAPASHSQADPRELQRHGPPAGVWDCQVRKI